MHNSNNDWLITIGAIMAGIAIGSNTGQSGNTIGNEWADNNGI